MKFQIKDNQDNELLDIDIEPGAADEDEHIYVCITTEDGECYEGRLPLVEASK